MTPTPSGGAPHDRLVCQHCGRDVVPRGTPGSYGHRSQGVIAACDLDSDHPATPDWRAAGELTCGRCGGTLTATPDNRLEHVDRGRDSEHAPSP